MSDTSQSGPPDRFVYDRDRQPELFDGVLSKLKFLGEDEDSELDNDPAARLDAEIVLLSGTLRLLLALAQTCPLGLTSERCAAHVPLASIMSILSKTR